MHDSPVDQTAFAGRLQGLLRQIEELAGDTASARTEADGWFLTPKRPDASPLWVHEMTPGI
jgi:hypothetical protein